MTPYCSGSPINLIPPVEPLDPDVPHRKQVYQSIFGGINWLATLTRPDIAPSLPFIALYINYPHQQHYKSRYSCIKISYQHQII